MSIENIKTDVIVIGAGISGLATVKCLRDDGFRVIVLERTSEVGGLWTFREHDYGVMRFTHINVSKYNYSFSDFPFPDETADFPHHSDMAKYILDYTKHFQLREHIKFRRKVTKLEQTGDNLGWRVTTQILGEDGEPTDSEEIYEARYVAVASGHHAKPVVASFSGLDTFTGKAIHSVDFKDAVTNGMEGKRVLVVGIGNSGVDVATNCASEGRCKSVYLSTRSGAWIYPNYIAGRATDLYACRAFLNYIPWTVGSTIFETIVSFLLGHPRKWKLNPKMRALQTQPTVSPTLIHHIQRRHIKIVPNIKKIEENRVTFINDESDEFDAIVLCTGYKIDLPFLEESVRSKVLDEETNSIKLYMNMVSPEIGHSLAFVGFIQPASGGLLSMSENQARWFTELCRGRVSLPTKAEMIQNIQDEEAENASKYYKSSRHTIQRDPIIYNDQITSFFGAKPELLKNPTLAWRLMVGSCGSAQYRLQGPGSWEGAKETVMKVPVTELMHYSLLLTMLLIPLAIYWIFSFLCFLVT
ncbi:hypothetical protein FSP39_013123 [Pinctada imbricata]|uniref:Flavin-containing monooxygenase n=1 Tax=Pinctada imbricata TaxID=66713 RepID=A0AA88Y0A0_PINIB|nr:hypothetical protein FSP39_013123 [Pinctada imbricata]